MSFSINRVYTRSGDKGETSLVDGSRVSKNSKICAAFGTIDELNSTLGICKEFVPDTKKELLIDLIEYLQQELFDLGSELATPTAYSYPEKWEVKEIHIEHLEKLCDFFNKDLPELKSFILPGGSKFVSFLHLARSICRRAERMIVEMSKETSLNPLITAYINRLGDLLFILCRYGLVLENKETPLWIQEKKRLSPLQNKNI